MLVTPDLPVQLKGDATRLLQVLLNLTSNALKFTQVGEVRIQVQVVARRQATVTLNIAVVDTGIGIPAASLATLFNKYTKVSTSTARL
jgi:signal transduction histidine kinase